MLHLGTLRCKHRTRIGQVTQGFDEECYSFRRCESRLDSASFKVGAGHNFCIFLIILHIFASGPSNKSTDRCCSWPCFRICVGGSGPALTCLATVPGLLCLVAKNLYLMNLCICAWTCVGASLWLLYTFVALIYIYICIYLHFATWFHLVLQGGRSARGFETLKLEGVTQPTADSLLLEKSDCRKPQEWPLTFCRSRRCTLGSHISRGHFINFAGLSTSVTFFCWKFVNGVNVCGGSDGRSLSYLFLSVYSAGLFCGRVTG